MLTKKKKISCFIKLQFLHRLAINILVKHCIPSILVK